jgi:hypothetical protein
MKNKLSAHSVDNGVKSNFIYQSAYNSSIFLLYERFLITLENHTVHHISFFHNACKIIEPIKIKNTPPIIGSILVTAN